MPHFPLKSVGPFCKWKPSDGWQSAVSCSWGDVTDCEHLTGFFLYVVLQCSFHGLWRTHWSLRHLHTPELCQCCFSGLRTWCWLQVCGNLRGPVQVCLLPPSPSQSPPDRMWSPILPAVHSYFAVSTDSFCIYMLPILLFWTEVRTFHKSTVNTTAIVIIW